MPSRRARPTLRVLREDLKDGWEDPYPRRRLDDGDLASLHPLSELPHPIIAKAAEAFGEEAGQDNYVGRIGSCTSIYLCEIKSAQWRGGVWIAGDGVCWLIVATIAKGDHEDWNDFYQRVKRADSDIVALLPTRDDERLLKQEVARRHLATWDLTVQAHVAAALERSTQVGRPASTWCIRCHTSSMIVIGILLAST